MTFSSRKAPFRLCVILVLVTDILSSYTAQALTKHRRGLAPDRMVPFPVLSNTMLRFKPHCIHYCQFALVGELSICPAG